MATDTTTGLMTTDEFLPLAEEEGVTRELIYSQLTERPLTIRSPRSGVALVKIGSALLNWLDGRPDIFAIVGCGESRCRLATDPNLIVGIDIAYYEGIEAVRQCEWEPFFDGPPVIAVEVLAPSDTHVGVVKRIQWCLSHGTNQVWIADPDLRTVTVHRPDTDATFYNAGQELSAEPDLPGFRVPVRQLFVTQ